MKKWIKITLAGIAFFSLHATCKELTDDLSIQYLLKPFEKASAESEDLVSEKILPILQQKYTYLGKGKQAFVFLSEDKQHVLKVFKTHFPSVTIRPFRKPYNVGLYKLPFVRDVLQKVYAKEIEAQSRKDFESYETAFSLLQEETGVEYLHLRKTDTLNHKLVLYDKIGILHEVDLDGACFLVQKRTDLLYQVMASLVKQGNSEKMKELIRAHVDLSLTLLSKGIERPTIYYGNFGCIDSKVFQIDIGRVGIVKDIAAGPKIGLDYCVVTLRGWLEKYAPDLTSYLDEAMEEGKKKYEEGV